jgi:hypothetical protein
LYSDWIEGVREVWKYLTKLAPEKSRRVGSLSQRCSAGLLTKYHKEFHGVGVKEFELIERVVETGRLVSKPRWVHLTILSIPHSANRLTYDYNELVLIVDMPSNLHEESFDYFKECLTLAIASIPYDRKIIRPRISMNYRLKIEGKTVTPDLTVTIAATLGPMESVVVLGLGECALSENKVHVFTKMRKEVTAHPEVDFAIIALIKEAMPYECPIPDSTTFKTLISEDDADHDPLSLRAFIRQRSTPRQFNNPIKVAEHNWCQVESVEYFVWTKGVNGTPINIDDRDPQRMAYGVSGNHRILLSNLRHWALQTLAPTVDMDSVTTMLEQGLSRMRESMVGFTQEVVSNADCSALASANVTLPIDWSFAASGILSAMDTTAYQRYEDWFVATKRDRDSSYSPSDPELQEPTATRPRILSTACEQASTSQPSSRKYKGRGRGKGKGASKRGRAAGASMGDRWVHAFIFVPSDCIWFNFTTSSYDNLWSNGLVLVLVLLQQFLHGHAHIIFTGSF